MRALFPAIPGTLVTSFDADIEGRGQVHVELWQSASSISRILRWPIGDTGLFREAAADEAYLRLEVPFDVEPPWLADRGLVVENVLDEGTLLRVRLLDPLGFWLDLEAARERMGNSVDIEFQAVLRVIPDSLPSQRLNLDDDLNRIGARIWPDSMTAPAEPIVAVIDTGVDTTHPCLQGRLASRGGLINLVSPGDPPEDDHYQSHGTFCAGLIAGDPAPGFFGGLLQKGSILVIKAFDSTGMATARRAAEAIDVAVAAGARVICCAWSGLVPSPELPTSIAAAGEKGCLVVTASGNFEVDIDVVPQFPASYGDRHLAVVGGLSDNLEPVRIWGIGKTSVDLLAPGESVLSAVRSYLHPYYPYGRFSGTSASTAILTAAAALVQYAARHFRGDYISVSDLKTFLLHSAEVLGIQHAATSCTGGYLHLPHAVEMVQGTFKPRSPPNCP